MENKNTAYPRVPWGELLTLFLGSRMLIALLAPLSLLIIAPGEHFGGQKTFLETLTRWDGSWYLGIAADGYGYTPGTQSPVAFFPLYPMTVRIIGFLVGNLTAGFVVSNAALFGALVLLWKLAEDEATTNPQFTAGDGLRAARLLAYGPVSLFFSLIYSEALFLFLTLATIYAARRQRWWTAGLLGLGAALTRNVGLFLAAPLLCEYLGLQWRRPLVRRQATWSNLIPCLFPFGGIVLWSAYLYWRFGDPLLFLKVQEAWQRHLSWPWIPFTHERLWNFPPFHQWWFVGHACVGVAFFLLALRAKIRPSLVAIGMLYLLLDFSANHLEAIPRLLSVVFPIYFGAATLTRKSAALEYAIISFSAGLLALSTILYVNGYWFT
jgi:hypothetical protein